ncbi:MAG: GNAT family N-acetyltransferase [Gemmatimonadaceae bacterium]|nr:GNAT family N-acetyltransferase [Gemmatimonadaceae bacterium]NUQ93989.1 GNAT family N-acetyltransferase [Gemmatimonadaceae bacterium]NUR17973.1 GNAT family N-acetyltransferase [Gemmatimonadaceae bacterium]NUS96131.1 GNAT family N-acetyltransferase [Gemmatimonadaceae bacterium]
MPTVLDAGSCILRPFRPGDEESVARHANDRRVAIQLRDRFPHPYTIDDAHEWVSAASTLDPVTTFAITLPGDDDETIGGIGLLPGSDIERIAAEVGYWLGVRFWNRGLTTAALRAITAYGFETLALERIFALPFATNVASVRVLEKAGYQREGLLRRSAIKEGVVMDQAVYAKIREYGSTGVREYGSTGVTVA